MATGTDRLVEQISDLYLNEKLSDATIVIDNVKLPAHRVILGQRCRYFEAMFESGMIESTSKRIDLRETPIDGFKAVLKWIYTGTVQLTAVDAALEVLRLAHMYELSELVNLAVDFLKGKCNVENVCSILSEAVLLSLDELTDFAIELVSANFGGIFKHESFGKLSKDALNRMLTDGVHNASNADIFRAAVCWMKANPSKSADFPDVFSNVALEFITLKNVADVPSDVLDAIVQLIRQQNLAGPTYCLKDKNVAVPKYGVKVIAGGNTSFFDKHTTGILQHVIGTSGDGIVVDLGRRFKLNSFKMQLPDTDKNFSYWIAVSEDNVNWTRVIDHSKYLCRSLQNLYIKPRPVRFIRIRGTAPTDDIFQFSRFEASHTTEQFDVDPKTTLMSPSDNISLVEKNAIVIQGNCHPNNAIINGTFQGDTGSTGFTEHIIDEGAIIVQLPQPYLLASMKLLLWDGDDRVYSYNIEVSVDQANWTRVFSEERVSSWREVHFEKQPVVFIKLTGTYNSAFNVFHCVHLECPAITRQ